MSIDRRGLAAALRRARERVSPEDVGLPGGARRRVLGLRREELAMLAGVSVDYVVRLEQGRGPHPSEQVMGALTRALRLEDDERAHVLRLAGLEPPRPGRVDRHVRPSVLRLVDRLEDLPAMVLSATSDVLAWNAMSSALLGDWSVLAPQRRNQLRLRFLPEATDSSRPRVGRVGEEAESTARQSVASLRSAAGRYPDDPTVSDLVADLCAGSAEFARRWQETDAGIWRSHVKTVEHPEVGSLRLDCEALHLPDTDQLLVVYSAAPGSPAAEGLALLRVLGTQRLSERQAGVEDARPGLADSDPWR